MAGSVSPPYGAEPNSDLLSRIPLDARLVVDVGCGAGGLGRAFRRRNPATRFVGVELDESLAAEAEKHLDEVLAIDIDTDDLPFRPGGVDCLIYGDVLEHLVEPWAVLRRHAKLLSEDGVLLACIPNLEHWSFAAQLLLGTWQYRQVGLQARDHLRWFTRETMRDALVQAGLEPCDVHARIIDQKNFERFAAQVEPTLKAMGVDPAEYARRATPYQYVWRAMRRAPRPLSIVGRTLRPQAAMIDVRMLEPLIALFSRPGLAIRLGVDPKVPAVPPGSAGIFILQRIILSPSAIPYLRAIRQAGYVIVQEFDDDPAHNLRVADAGNMAFTAVHAVQTSTDPLAEVLREWNPEVAVMPNALSELPDTVNFRNPDQLRLFFGAINRERDVAPFLPALNAVLAEAGERLAVEVIHDRGAFEALQTPHKRFTPLCDYARYKALMGACDIAFLPLAENRFNSLKSDLKWVEASGHGLVSIASPTVYAGSIRHGETGFIAATPEEFATCLRAILADPARARAIALAARAEVAATRLYAHQIAHRRAWYESLWERRAELDAKLLERVPQLAG